MKVRDFSRKKAFQVLATQSRRADLSAKQLSDLHQEMGKLLAYEMIEDMELTSTMIQHVQGMKEGLEVKAKGEITIFALMRAGLFCALGIRDVFPDAAIHLLSGEDLQEVDLTGKTVIVVDAVINSGKTVHKILKRIQGQKLAQLFVSTLVMQKEAEKLAVEYPNVYFYAFRISENKYTGTGGTDTGNRLFNTILK